MWAESFQAVSRLQNSSQKSSKAAKPVALCWAYVHLLWEDCLLQPLRRKNVLFNSAGYIKCNIKHFLLYGLRSERTIRSSSLTCVSPAIRFVQSSLFWTQICTATPNPVTIRQLNFLPSIDRFFFFQWFIPFLFKNVGFVSGLIWLFLSWLHVPDFGSCYAFLHPVEDPLENNTIKIKTPSRDYPLPPAYASRDCVSHLRNIALGVHVQLFICSESFSELLFSRV